MRISDWSSDVCSSDLPLRGAFGVQHSESQFSAVGEEAFLPESETRNTALFLMETLAAGPVRLELAARQEWQRIETTLNREISHKPFRSEARRVGTECVSTCRSRWAQDH